MTLVSMHASAWCIKYIRIIFGQVDEKTNRMLIAALGKRKKCWLIGTTGSVELGSQDRYTEN